MTTAHGLLFLSHARFHVTRELAHDPRLTAEQVVAGEQMVSRELFDKAAATVEGGKEEIEILQGRIADGQFTLAGLWAAIVAFFESPVGQMILKALVTMILAMLGL